MSTITLRIVWSKTQDHFDIEPENPDFAKWFVEQSVKFGNMFSCSAEKDPSQDELISRLNNTLLDVNRFLTKIGFSPIPIPSDLYSQHELNALHKNWISVVRKYPKLDLLIYKDSPELHSRFHDVNGLVHKIERRFKYKCLGSPYWRVENAFKDITPSNMMCNVCINYADWGKSSWDKFIDGIDDPDDFELSNWKTIGSSIGIDLSYPYDLAFPPSYLDYCSKHKVPVTVKSWPLGNLKDYQSTMPTVRKIMNKNSQLSDNHLSFIIVE